jgi:predicted amidophosphoribosyltransferase
MLCETCAKEFDKTLCPHCGEDIFRFGAYCYLCGGEVAVAVAGPIAEEAAEDDDFSRRILCSDGTCIGVIDEKGICKVCGKSYTPESE